MVAGKVFIKQAEELFADVGLDIEAEWRVEPNYISCPVSFLLTWVRGEGQQLRVATVFERFVVIWSSTVKLVSHELLEIRLLIIAGICLMMLGGWFDWTWMYRASLLGFLYG